MSTVPTPKRGEVWLVNLDPTVGAEINKTRWVIVVSSDGVVRLPLKVVVPLTSWKEHFRQTNWLIEIPPSSSNGLTAVSAADTLQVRCVALERFIRKEGKATSTVMREIAAAIAALVEYE